MLDKLFCQLRHGRWARLVSYSSHGAWRCVKPGCRAQMHHDAATQQPGEPRVLPGLDKQQRAA